MTDTPPDPVSPPILNCDENASVLQHEQSNNITARMTKCVIHVAASCGFRIISFQLSLHAQAQQYINITLNTTTCSNIEEADCKGVL